MKRKINKSSIRFKLKISQRARYMRLEIRRDGELVVTAPRGIHYKLVEKFVAEKSKWIADNMDYILSVKDKIFLGGNKREYLQYKNLAKLLAENKIKYYNALYNFQVNRITIKNQKSRWGSCSKKGNLNFNYKIALLPENLADYIIVHELCHLAEFNHSRKFWKLVSLTIPNYVELRKKFK